MSEMKPVTTTKDLPALKLQALSEPTSSALLPTIADPQELAQVREIAQSIDLSDTSGVISFGRRPQENLNATVTSQVGNLRMKDMGQGGKLLLEFQGTVKGLKIKDLTEQDGFGLEDIPLVGPLFDKLRGFLRQYEKTEPIMNDIIRRVAAMRVTAEREITELDLLHQLNGQYLRQLELWIAGGELALQNQSRIFEQKKVEAQTTTDVAKVQALRDLYNQLQRLDRTVYNLKLARNLALMNGPSIRITQEHSASVVEFCNNIQNFAVVQWWLQVRMAVAHYRNRLGIELDRKAKEFTDQLVMGNAQMLGINTTAIKEAQGRGFVGIDALKQYNATLIQVLENDVKSDQMNLEKRRQHLTEVHEAEARLKQAQLAVANAVTTA